LAHTGSRLPTPVEQGESEEAYDFGRTQFDDAVRAATCNAFAETLAAGLDVFYIGGDGLNEMEPAILSELLWRLLKNRWTKGCCGELEDGFVHLEHRRVIEYVESGQISVPSWSEFVSLRAPSRNR
jgi:hypothetical protein